MTTNRDLDPSEPSHDDVSNRDGAPDQAIPDFGDDPHDENDDAPPTPASGSGDRRAPAERTTGKSNSNFAPDLQDASSGSE